MGNLTSDPADIPAVKKDKKIKPLPRKKTSKKKDEFDQELADKCSKLLGARIASMKFPGGSTRESVKLILKKGNPVYATTRSRTSRADTERLILSTLAKSGHNVPKLMGSDGKKLLIQESIPGLRLTQALHDESDAIIELRLSNALESLAAIQKAGSAQGLDQKLEPLGNSQGWLQGLLERPAVIGDFFDRPAPAIDFAGLELILAARQPRFVKWDARPGNAIARPDNEVFWIDWEHCGTRNRLDDMVWLLADEFIPERPEIEARLLGKFIPAFADDLNVEQATRYFYAMGVFHSVIRMGLIFRYKKDGSWWSFKKCLAGDKVGVTRRNMRRICLRGERWSQINVETAALAQWFASIRQYAEAL